MLTDALGAPFESIDGETAVRIAREAFGLDVETAQRFETERDDTFRVVGGDGAFALKLSHPADCADDVDLEVACVEHALAVDPGLPLARFLPVADRPWDTGPHGRMADIDGRIARCALWMPGTALRDAPRSLAQVRAVAAAMTRLGAALEGLEHPAADRALAWDLQRLPELRDRAAAVPEQTRGAVVAVIDAVKRDAAPALATLPHQLVHQDANLDNLLVADDDPATIAAILDFGDAVRSTRVADLAVAASYLLPVAAEDPSAAEVLEAVVAGAAGIAPLSATETALLPLLAAGRLAQRLVLGWWLMAAAPPNVDYVSRSLAITARQLEAIAPLVGLHRE